MFMDFAVETCHNVNFDYVVKTVAACEERSQGVLNEGKRGFLHFIVTLFLTDGREGAQLSSDRKNIPRIESLGRKTPRS